jgi:hypothetical protein
MVRRLIYLVAMVAALASAGERAWACDRATAALVQPQVLSLAPAEVVVPLTLQPATPLAVAPLAVAPLAVVPLEARQVIVPLGGHRVAVRSSTATIVRPLVVRPSRARSVTRVRTLVR